jgi:type IV pilus assembly protein PilA
MFCTHCGKDNPEQGNFCCSCGSPLSAAPQQALSAEPTPNPTQRPRIGQLPPSVTPRIGQRPGIVTLLSVLQFVGSFISLLVAVVGFGAAFSTAEVGTLLFAIFFGGLAALQAVCGIGLWKLKGYGRTIHLVFSWIGLIGFPIWTIISILILVYLYKPGIKILFSEKSVAQLTAEEMTQVQMATQGSMGVVLAAVVAVVVGIAVIGIIAAIAVPGLLRARMSGNEASAIGSLRAINRAQEQYYERCNGYAPSLLELVNAGDLLPSDLIGAATVTKSGYQLTVELSANGASVPDRLARCAVAVTDYFAHAEPVTPGATGTRYFASNSSGTIFQNGTAPIAEPIQATAIPVR